MGLGGSWDTQSQMPNLPTPSFAALEGPSSSSGMRFSVAGSPLDNPRELIRFNNNGTDQSTRIER